MFIDYSNKPMTFELSEAKEAAIFCSNVNDIRSIDFITGKRIARC